ncbi:MAG: Tetracycline resistance protein, class B [Chlamydiia bacterium]|nr:Tetracycline resistance protein, class B [Chlamydiia bacterium]
MKTRNLSLFAILFVFFLDNFGFALAFPIVPPMLLSDHSHFFSPDISTSLRSVLLAIALSSLSIGQFIGAPIIGDLADSIGRKRVFYITIIGTASRFFVVALAIYLQSYILLVVARFLSGLVASNVAICLASISDLSESENEKGRNFGWISTILGIGLVVSSLVNGFMIHSKFLKSISPSLPFILCGFLLLLSLLFIKHWFTETRTLDKKFRFNLGSGFKHVTDAFRDRETSITYLSAFFWYMSWLLMIRWTTPYYLHEDHATRLEITYLIGTLGVAWALGSAFLNTQLVKKIETMNLYIWSTFVLFVIFLAIPILKQPLYLYIGLFLAGVAGSVAWPNLSNTLSLVGKDEHMGKLMGLNQAMLALGEVIGPILGGFLVMISYSFIYYFAAIFAFIAFIIMFFEKKHFVKRSFM